MNPRYILYNVPLLKEDLLGEIKICLTMIKNEFLNIKLAYLNVSNPNWAVYVLTLLIVSNANVDLG